MYLDAGAEIESAHMEMPDAVKSTHHGRYRLHRLTKNSSLRLLMTIRNIWSDDSKPIPASVLCILLSRILAQCHIVRLILLRIPCGTFPTLMGSSNYMVSPLIIKG